MILALKTNPEVQIQNQKVIMDEEKDSEQQLIEKAKNDPASFEPLYKKYYPPILRFIYKRVEDVDDCRELASNVFTKALTNIGKYRYMGFPFSSWLYRIAINEINQFYRDSKKMRAISIDENGMRQLAEESGQDNKDLRAVLASALEHLSEDEMQLIELRFFEERPFSEVGQLLDITENNAKVKTYRVLDKLRNVFSKLNK
jgi:RNA polymerase sigma-70 factor (ECF subfamily)